MAVRDVELWLSSPVECTGDDSLGNRLYKLKRRERSAT